MSELGCPQLEATAWFGVLVPARTPGEIVNSLNSAIREALNADAVKTDMAQFAYEAAPASPSEFAKLIVSALCPRKRLQAGEHSLP